MVDIDPSQFFYRRRPTISSFMWALLLRMPQTLRTSVYRCVMRVGEQTSSPSVFRLPFGLYAKAGDDSNVIEALATQYVSMNSTSIPVPTILDIIKDDSVGSLFLMTRVPGRPLADMEGDLDTLSPEQLSVFSNTMRDWLTQLRSLTPPSDGLVCGFLGGDFSSYRIKFDSRVGPFESQDVFHAQAFCTLRPSSGSTISALAQSVRQKRYRICLTHGVDARILGAHDSVVASAALRGMGQCFYASSSTVSRRISS
ncbi:hypothetical protein BDZ97DRAFT_1917976 [Flammula alnicola]|nr:hypothetical protein BDZ97DRAFT_1917976 [Flammula alnicola]